MTHGGQENGLSLVSLLGIHPRLSFFLPGIFLFLDGARQLRGSHIHLLLKLKSLSPDRAHSNSIDNTKNQYHEDCRCSFKPPGVPKRRRNDQLNGYAIVVPDAIV